MGISMENRISTKQLLLAFLSIPLMVAANIVASLVGGVPSMLGFPEWICNILFTVLYVATAVFSIKHLCCYVLKIPMAEFRVSRLHIGGIWAVAALFLPLLVTAVLLYLPGRFQKNCFDATETAGIITAAVFYYGIGAGIVEEVVFRGVVMAALEKRFNKTVAVLVPSVLFGLIHVFGNELDAVSFLLLLVSGTAVGVMFSLVTLESGSVWSSALMHAVWNCIMIGGIFSIGASHSEEALYTYELNSTSVLLTGGDFGIEASVAAIGGYALFAAIALLLIRHNKRKDKV